MTTLERLLNPQVPWLDEGYQPEPTLPIEDVEAKFVADILKALGHPLRIQIIGVLGSGTCTVQDLAAELERPQAAVSKHLSILKSSGLITSAVRGKQHIYSLVRNDLYESVLKLAREIDA